MARQDRLLQEYRHDPYFVKEKYRDPSVCEKCGVLFRNGAFEWVAKIPANAEKIVCPACKRIEDKFEGGVVFLQGSFLENHKAEIRRIIENTETAEQKTRPLERILSVTDQGAAMEIRTTYEHLARRIGSAVHNACKGELTIQYPEGEKYARVFWKRDAA